ncbi:hypothetical protein AB0M43_28035 [Longispora sp. NPDC051575]|uniref:hypothetical protein n=1 Tax=Longispora sp. NPDC051575 TaxID=3154943 RepID=UPI0034326203
MSAVDGFLVHIDRGLSTGYPGPASTEAAVLLGRLLEVEAGGEADAIRRMLQTSYGLRFLETALREATARQPELEPELLRLSERMRAEAAEPQVPPKPDAVAVPDRRRASLLLVLAVLLGVVLGFGGSKLVAYLPGGSSLSDVATGTWDCLDESGDANRVPRRYTAVVAEKYWFLLRERSSLDGFRSPEMTAFESGTWQIVEGRLELRWSYNSVLKVDGVSDGGDLSGSHRSSFGVGNDDRFEVSKVEVDFDGDKVTVKLPGVRLTCAKQA